MSFNISKVCVIGTGTMGTGIAAQIVAAGIPVCFLDVVPEKLGEDDIKAGLTESSYEFRNKIPLQAMKNMENSKLGIVYDSQMCKMVTIGNLEDDLERISDCDWIVEVIVERLDIKKSLLKKIEPYIKDTAIVSSNTSGVSIAKIVEDLPRGLRKRFLGTHFFNPPRFMKLMELIPGADTDEKVYEYMSVFGRRRLGKEIVNAKDTPNFVANRIGMYSNVVALQLMEKYGYGIEKVDQLTGKEMMRPKSAVHKTIDMVGLDIMYNIALNLSSVLSDAAEIQALTPPRFVEEMVKAGQLGNKTKAGFYKTVKKPEGRQKLVWDYKVKEYKPVENVKVALVEQAKKQKSQKEKLLVLIGDDCEESRFAWEVIKGTLLYSANRIPEIADDYKEIDRAMRYGYNWEIGPFEIWDKIGVRSSVERMQAEGENIPAWIQTRLEQGKENFYDADISDAKAAYPVIKESRYSAILDMGDGVIGFDMRSKGNAINFELIDELQEAIKAVNNNSDIKGMVLTCAATNFCNGADLRTILEKIEADDFEGLGQGIDRFHETSMMLKYAKKPIVAAVHGMVLGGGLEFMMHCHKTVAYAESYMGLVEAGVGLVPGGGGMKELMLRFMKKIKGFALTDDNPIVQKAWEIVAMAKVSKNAFDAKNMGFLRNSDRILLDSSAVNGAAKEEVIRIWSDGFEQKAKENLQVTGFSGKAYLKYIIAMMRSGNMISAYDALIAEEIAWVLTGGDLPKKAEISEIQMLALEREAFLRLAANALTKDRIKHMLKEGKPLRN